MILMSIAVAADDKDKLPFKAGPASSYPGFQSLDKITIAAVPFVTKEQAQTAFGKVNPYDHGILPVLVVLENATGTRMINVPFKGNGPALTEVMAGRVSFMFYPAIGIADQVSAGRLKVLAVEQTSHLAEVILPNFVTV